jgi:hypothetical protein
VLSSGEGCLYHTDQVTKDGLKNIFASNVFGHYALVSSTCISIHFFLGLVWFMVFNATFHNIAAISWQSVLLIEETGVPAENHRPVASR